jgi:hypothetical protein
MIRSRQETIIAVVACYIYNPQFCLIELGNTHFLQDLSAPICPAFRKKVEEISRIMSTKPCIRIICDNTQKVGQRTRTKYAITYSFGPFGKYRPHKASYGTCQINVR